MQTPTRTAGLTLIELLITLGIVGMILNVVFLLLNQGIGSSNNLVARAGMVQDAQVVQRLLAGRLNEAIYVYGYNAAGSAASNSFAFGSGVTVNAVGYRGTGGSAWALQTDPILAMILPPKTPGGECVQDANTTVNPDGSDGCFRFFAYYPLKRNTLTSATLSPSNKPDMDPANDNRWVLMEYRRNLYCSGVNWRPSYNTDGSFNASLLPPRSGCIEAAGVSARLLADFVRPSDNPTTGGFDVVVNTAQKDVSFTLAFERASGSSTLELPSSSGATLQSYITTVRPKNWF
ncbi:hypothetical protein [Deinococcus maricopensis]|uniref:Prepilin-type N-terminal cleavage/methylation domain-containing protein n=1 Tax=Deinococcus maricopensis (strain DSM 21211 / LMG 22137 / NRRL B-23946 / LB-34) TaxID=709986 RepID=E8UB12_DEIML|nr:hypothetical protein [Deinococcus maricopensis]ADV68251.1 hypothetical protein Deima_2618 [Deinococcus maricopensis DSM 21211]